MKAYSVFDDFSSEACSIVRSAGISLTVHPTGMPRPNAALLKELLQEYDCLFIGTGEKIAPDLFESVHSPRIIATASSGTDHIRVPECKQHLIRIINCPGTTALPVAEYTIGCALSCCKRLSEGGACFRSGKTKSSLVEKPVELYGKTIGVIGAGAIGTKIMEYASLLGMRVLYWTAHPEKHLELPHLYSELEALCEESDVISVNLPNSPGTEGIISKDLIERMKETCVFISVSRLPTIDFSALIQKAERYPNFYVNLDIDPSESAVSSVRAAGENVIVTPHIAGGTVETRRRMFVEIASAVAKLAKYKEVAPCAST